MTNIKNPVGMPPRKTCIRPVCVKRVPIYTPTGHLKAPGRMREQKYCSSACARLHNLEENAMSVEQIEAGREAMNRFIYPPELRSG